MSGHPERTRRGLRWWRNGNNGNNNNNGGGGGGEAAGGNGGEYHRPRRRQRHDPESDGARSEPEPASYDDLHAGDFSAMTSHGGGAASAHGGAAAAAAGASAQSSDSSVFRQAVDEALQSSINFGTAPPVAAAEQSAAVTAGVTSRHGWEHEEPLPPPEPGADEGRGRIGPTAEEGGGVGRQVGGEVGDESEGGGRLTELAEAGGEEEEEEEEAGGDPTAATAETPTTPRTDDRTCPICGRSFKYPYLLTIHASAHSNETKVQCPYCAFRCRWRSTMSYHKHRYHADMLGESSSAGSKPGASGSGRGGAGGE